MNNSTTTLVTTTAPTWVIWFYSARFWLSFGLIGFIINILELVLIFYNQKHKTIFGVTLSSLCIADILSGLCFFVVGLMRIVEHDGNEIIVITPNTQLASVYQGGHGALFFAMGTSFFHVIIIAIQRLFAVFLPLRYKQSFRYRHCVILIVSVWFLLFISAVVGYFYLSALWFASYVLSLTVCLILLLTYTAIVIKTFHAEMKRKPMATQRTTLRNDNLKTSHKVLGLSIAVTVAFLICTLPHAVFYLFVKSNMAYYHAVNSLISANPFMDSIIYFAFYHKRISKRAKPALDWKTPQNGKVSPITATKETNELVEMKNMGRNHASNGVIGIIMQNI